MHILYQCNGCGVSVVPRDPSSRVSSGVALKRNAGNVGVTEDWENADAHLCKTCGRAIGNLFLTGVFGTRNE